MPLTIFAHQVRVDPRGFDGPSKKVIEVASCNGGLLAVRSFLPLELLSISEGLGVCFEGLWVCLGDRDPAIFLEPAPYCVVQQKGPKNSENAHYA